MITTLEHSTRLLIGASICALLLAGCSGQTPQAPSGEPPVLIELDEWPAIEARRAPDDEIERQVDELLRTMTLEEKVGQIIQADIGSVTPAEARDYHLGSVLNGGNSAPGGNVRAAPEEWLALADAFFDASVDRRSGRSAIPLLWGTDAVHGHNNVVGATLFPHNIGLGAANDVDLLRRIAEITAFETTVTGMDWSFAPTLAVARNDRWGRTYESYSEDPGIVERYARSVIEGLQGALGEPDRLMGERVIATAKHFVGDGGTIDGLDQGNNVSGNRELALVHAAGYPPAIEAGVETIMASFNAWHGRKLHGHAGLLTDVLKNHWGFDGFVVGDWNGHGQVAGCRTDECPAAINAGVDMFMAPDSWKALYGNTLENVRRGDIPAARLDDAVRRILRVKLRAGLFGKPRPSSRPYAGRFELLGSAAHRAVAREAVRKSLVLLKNDNTVLPIAADARVLVAGPAADDVGRQSGGWTLSWQGTGNARADFPGATSIWEGIRDAVTAHGGSAELSADGSYGTKPDVAVVVFGERPYAEFEGDRPNVAFVYDGDEHLDTLERLRSAGIPVVSVFLSGRPLWVNRELNRSDAFVAAWLPGSEGGGLADVLIAADPSQPQYDFTGRLSFSWPAAPDDAELNLGDEDYAPLFAFGYGLDYGSQTVVDTLPESAAATLAADDPANRFLVRGRAVPPWQMVLSDRAGETVVTAGTARSTLGTLEFSRVDYGAQEDAIALRAGPTHAGLLLRGTATDLARAANADLSLQLILRIDRPLDGPVSLRLGCAGGCDRTIELGKLADPAAVGVWQDLRVPLKCFSSDTPGQVTEALRLESDTGFDLSLHRVALGSTEGELRCP
ncbi:MAG: glycoside hydrolase family 3 N-terminal domain-containing protein [Pseudomonadota bacterium]